MHGKELNLMDLWNLLLNIMDYFKEFWKYVFEKRNLMFIKNSWME